MAAATAIAIKQAQETARLANELAEIRKRLERIESMCEQALAILEHPAPITDLSVAELVTSVEYATKEDIRQMISEALAKPVTRMRAG